MLSLRIFSALVLIPLALGAVWAGAWAFVALAVVAAVLLGWEWTRLCQDGRYGPAGLALSVIGAVAVILAHLAPFWAFPAVFLGMASIAFVPGQKNGSAAWMVGGVVYIAVPALSLVWISGQGRETLLWLLVVVWATDIGAYGAGRLIGGPKLMPKVSPKKTWAGLGGGVIWAALVGLATSCLLDGAGPSAALLMLISAALAVVAQAGDLFESWVKRHFGVKDSSGIIPGHGGVMDRLDGLLAAALPVALLCLALGGGVPLW